jgi:hypothetical protein
MSKEYYVLRSLSLHATNGVVHLELQVDDWQDEGNIVFLEYDARQLKSDIPALYRFCKSAIEQEDKYEHNKYKEFEDQIVKDLKKPVGRPKK